MSGVDDKAMMPVATGITVTIPVELTRSMIIRAGVIGDEARALELAIELHEVVARCVELYRADKTRLVEFPNEDFNAEPVELEPLREHNALEIADFTLAVWRQALVSPCEENDSPDAHEAAWISELLAGLCCDKDDDLYLRWLMIGDAVTGSDVADMLMQGGVN
jgi:hypothetical protein